jgi:hypothetical protein
MGQARHEFCRPTWLSLRLLLGESFYTSHVLLNTFLYGERANKQLYGSAIITVPFQTNQLKGDLMVIW